MRLTRDRGNLHPQCFERHAICRQQDGKSGTAEVVSLM
jgi:hypothetical protein